MERANPYDWQRHQPTIEIPRANVERTVERLARGKSLVLLAGRGMGKSVFLRQLRGALDELPDLHAVLLPEPPQELTTEAFSRHLAHQLGLEIDRPLGTREIFDAFFARAPGRLVLLYDEFDRYARPRGRPAPRATESSAGREFFNNFESVRRDMPQLGVLAAGSLGIFAFRDVLGSSFLARAEPVRLRPFALEELEQLARPFAERGQPLAIETLMALRLATGGNPALVTYGLEALWPMDAPSERDVARVFAEFIHYEGKEFLRDFEHSFADASFSDAPRRVFDLVRNARSPLSHDALRRACEAADAPLRLDFADVLDLLEAATLVRVETSLAIDPIDVRPIPSVLSLPEASPTAPGLAEQLRRDLGRLLARIHAAGVDFFRPGPRGEGKRLVPESVFAAFLALGFELYGWRVGREAQHGAGRTDLELRWNGKGEVAIVEVKIWGRGDWRDVHRQMERYWTSEVSAGAVAMLTDTEIADWPEVYRVECGAGTTELEASPLDDSTVRARLTWSSTTPDGLEIRVDHFLLRVPR